MYMYLTFRISMRKVHYTRYKLHVPLFNYENSLNNKIQFHSVVTMSPACHKYVRNYSKNIYLTTFNASTEWNSLIEHIVHMLECSAVCIATISTGFDPN